MPCVAILPQYFKKKRALANGIAASGSGIGGIIYPIMFRQLQLKIGFPWSTRVLGFVAFGSNLVSISILRVRFQPEEKRALVQIAAFKDPVYTLFCASQFIGFCGLYNMLVYIQPYSLDNSIMGEDLGFYLVSILNSASTVGRVIPNYIADRIGPFNVMIPMTLASGILGFCWTGIHTQSGVLALVALYGFTSGGFVSIPPTVMASITPDMRDFGTRVGMSFVFCALGALAGTPVGGAIINDTGDYFGVKMLVGSSLVTSSIFMALSRYMKTGPRLFVKA